jgi:general secretion pathway protein D
MNGARLGCLRTIPVIGSRFAIISALLLLLILRFVAPIEAVAASEQEPPIVRAIQLGHANARDLEPILGPLLSPTGSLAVDARTNSVILCDTEDSVRSMERAIEKLDVEIPSLTFHLDYADAEETAATISRIMGPACEIVEPNPRTRSIYVAAPAAKLEHIRSLISDLDRPPRQVLIEADILDVSSGKLKELGINWQMRLGYAGGEHDAVFDVGVGRSSPEEPPTGSILIGTPTVTIPAVFDALGNLVVPEKIFPGTDFSASIQALIEDSSTRTLSRPRILVLDGHPARFEVSTLEPYANTHYSERGGAMTFDIQFMDIGIILETIPHINDKGYVTLEVRPEISTLAGEEFFDTTIIPNEGGAVTNRIRVPVKAQNMANTTIMVRDNQTIAIGGLRSSENTEVISKVPILGDIPVLGIPFRNLNQGAEDRELIIFITPHIVSPDASSPDAQLLGLRQTAEPERK